MTPVVSGGELSVGEWVLEYRHIEPSDGGEATFVLLHEGLGSAALWKEFPQRLAAASGAGVFAYSRRGYGGSSPYAPPWPVDYMEQEAVLLGEVLDRLDLPSIILLGHSDGASIAAILQGSEPRACVRGLVLIAPHFFAEACSLASIRAAREHYLNGNLKQKLALYHGDNVDNAFEGWNGAWLRPEFEGWNIERFLPRINVPLLVIQGESDEYGTPAQVDAARKGTGGEVEVLMLEDCGHAPHLQATGPVVARIEAFAAGLFE